MLSPTAAIVIKTSSNVAAFNFKYGADDAEFSLSRKRLAPLDDESPEAYAILKRVKATGLDFTRHVSAERQEITLAEEVVALRKALQNAESAQNAQKLELEEDKATTESAQKAHKNELEKAKATAESAQEAHQDELKKAKATIESAEKAHKVELQDLKQGLEMVTSSAQYRVIELQQSLQRADNELVEHRRLEKVNESMKQEAEQKYANLQAERNASDEKADRLKIRYEQELIDYKYQLENRYDQDVCNRVQQVTSVIKQEAEMAVAALQGKHDAIDNDLCSEIQDKADKIIQQAKEIAEQKRQIAEQKKQITKHNKELEKRDATIWKKIEHTVKNNMDGLKQRIQKQTAKIQEQNGTIEEQTAKIKEQAAKIEQREAELDNALEGQRYTHQLMVDTEDLRQDEAERAEEQEERAKKLQSQVKTLQETLDFGDIASMMDKSTVSNRKRRSLPGEDDRNAAKMKAGHQIGKSNGGISKPKKTTTFKKTVREDSKEERSRKQTRRDENLGMDSMFCLPSPPKSDEEIL